MYMMDVILSIGIASSAIAEAWFIDVMKAYLGPEVMMPLARYLGLMGHTKNLRAVTQFP